MPPRRMDGCLLVARTQQACGGWWAKRSSELLLPHPRVSISNAHSGSTSMAGPWAGPCGHRQTSWLVLSSWCPHSHGDRPQRVVLHIMSECSFGNSPVEWSAAREWRRRPWPRGADLWVLTCRVGGAGGRAFPAERRVWAKRLSREGDWLEPRAWKAGLVGPPWGFRMGSRAPKGLHTVFGKELISYMLGGFNSNV